MKIVRTIKNKAYCAGFLVGAAKILMAILSRSCLVFIHAVYSIIKAGAGHYARNSQRIDRNTMFFSGFLVIAASAVYLVYSLYIYAFGSAATYHMYVAIGIAAVTTYELAISIYGLRKAKRKEECRRETVEYINLASALISVSLTQTAILSFTNQGTDMSKTYALGDAVFGFFALLTGIFMLIRAKRL